ncbi:hypothetical protein [Nocardioides limicola]|uniref:hypothetical protein n=1 Tax=Nocardioides limicola TaxID=2803368 RepID=UPI00193B7D59|nr:hypothetical protein [Nocardioides sp. DJM-14]
MTTHSNPQPGEADLLGQWFTHLGANDDKPDQESDGEQAGRGGSMGDRLRAARARAEQEEAEAQAARRAVAEQEGLLPPRRVAPPPLGRPTMGLDAQAMMSDLLLQVTPESAKLGTANGHPRVPDTRGTDTPLTATPVASSADTATVDRATEGSPTLRAVEDADSRSSYSDNLRSWTAPAPPMPDSDPLERLRRIWGDDTPVEDVTDTTPSSPDGDRISDPDEAHDLAISEAAARLAALADDTWEAELREAHEAAEREAAAEMASAVAEREAAAAVTEVDDRRAQMEAELEAARAAARQASEQILIEQQAREAAERAAAEATERIRQEEAARLEAERVAAEARAEAEKLAAERAAATANAEEAERLAAQAEAVRAEEAAQAEAARVEAAQAEAARAEALRIAAEAEAARRAAEASAAAVIEAEREAEAAAQAEATADAEAAALTPTPVETRPDTRVRDAELEAALEAARLAREQAEMERIAREEAERAAAAAEGRIRQEEAARAEAERLVLEATRLAADERARHETEALQRRTVARKSPTPAKGPKAAQSATAKATTPATPAEEPVETPRRRGHPQVSSRVDAPMAIPSVVKFKPRTNARRITGILELVALGGTAVAGYAAYQDQSPTTIAIAAVLGALLLVVHGVRSTTVPAQVRLENGTLDVLANNSHHRFDLSNPHVELTERGTPGKRGWRLLINRRNMSPYVITPAMVDPVAFMKVVRIIRPELD